MGKGVGLLTTVPLIQAIGAVLDAVTGGDTEPIHRTEEFPRAGWGHTGGGGHGEGPMRLHIVTQTHAKGAVKEPFPSPPNTCLKQQDAQSPHPGFPQTCMPHPHEPAAWRCPPSTHHCPVHTKHGYTACSLLHTHAYTLLIQPHKQLPAAQAVRQGEAAEGSGPSCSGLLILTVRLVVQAVVHLHARPREGNL